MKLYFRFGSNRAIGRGLGDSGAVTSKAENRAGWGPEASRVVTSKATQES